LSNLFASSSAILDPQVAESSKADFASLLEKSFAQEIKPGALTVGEVIRVEKDGLLVDVGGKYEGLVPIKEVPGAYSLEDLQAEYSPGQCREFYVLRDNEDDFQYLLSIRRVLAVKSWDDLLAIKDSQSSIEATVLGTTKGGILANVMGIKGFIPASQLRVTKNFEELTGDALMVKVLEVDRARNKLILSHRQAVFEQKATLRAETLRKLQEDDVVKGEVVKVTDFGVFVDINGIDGLLPLSEITWRRIKHPSDVLSLGEQVTVQVLTIDHDRQRISLSLKRMEEDPWNTVESRFQPGDLVEGRISKQLASGVLAEMIPGVEAYCAYGQHGKIFDLDVVYQFEIVSIAVHDRRLTLSYVEGSGPVEQPQDEAVYEQQQQQASDEVSSNDEMAAAIDSAADLPAGD
jgi:small subunit ribosomal protein S1